MRKISQLLVVAIVGLGLGLVVAGCNTSTAEQEKMKDDKMKEEKMKDDKMKDDKMKDDKMKNDKKMDGNKMDDKMKGDKMKDDKMKDNGKAQSSSLWRPRDEFLHFATLPGKRPSKTYAV